jgi:hypothetical protein
MRINGTLIAILVRLPAARIKAFRIASTLEPHVRVAVWSGIVLVASTVVVHVAMRVGYAICAVLGFWTRTGVLAVGMADTFKAVV